MITLCAYSTATRNLGEKYVPNDEKVPKFDQNIKYLQRRASISPCTKTDSQLFQSDSAEYNFIPEYVSEISIV